ncbi:hypothetical protein NC651_019623 [Populus alba x Populus x berolinensis]|nr:hypothetical protein NC651_019623 [Populus alba x Populus x berolinensis]
MAQLGILMKLVFLMDFQIDRATFLVHHSISSIRPAPNSVLVTIPAFCPPLSPPEFCCQTSGEACEAGAG